MNDPTEKAWGFFANERRNLEGFVIANCGLTREQAEDVVSDVGLGYVRNLDRVKDHYRYLYVASFNRAVTSKQKTQREIAADLSDPGYQDSIDQHAMGDLLAVELRVALESDLNTYKTDAVLVALQSCGFTRAELAEAQGCSEPALRSRLLRARQRSRQALEAVA